MAGDMVATSPAVHPPQSSPQSPQTPCSLDSTESTPTAVAPAQTTTASESESKSIQDDYPDRYVLWDVAQISNLYSVVHIVLLPLAQPAVASSCDCTSSDSLDSSANVSGDSSPNGHIGQQVRQKPSHRLLHALHKAGCECVKSPATSISFFTAILPLTDGYVTRSDFLRLRLQDAPYPISHVHELLQPLEKYTVFNIGPESNPHALVKHAAGIVQWADLDFSTPLSELAHRLSSLTQELKARLGDAPWLSPEPIARKRIALVRGRPNLTAGGPIYRAAEALGLDLVVISEEGHWLQPETQENKKHREAFIVTDMTEDGHTAERFVAAVKSYPLPIHGIFTLSDNFFVAVAKAAEALGLPTSPVSAYETSVDKYRSRLLQDSPGQTARVSSAAELEVLLQTPSKFCPSFPMIVKPTKGWGSESVSRVPDLASLTLAVQKATSRHGGAAVIEPFFDGPEIDVNFVLLDGEILFCEIADEPPCQADARNATVHDTFSPEAVLLPSALPAHEQEIAKNTLRDILVNLGFRTGVFHVEARMVNSECAYRDFSNGVVDLVPKSLPPENPTCRLLEINARPPGFRVSVPSKLTYGVDYFAAHMLAAVGDRDRLRLTTHPFRFPQDDIRAAAGAQYWSKLLYIPVPADGTVRRSSSGLTPCEELTKLRCPHLAGNIVYAFDYFQPGERITRFDTATGGAGGGVGVRNYAASVLVCSRRSRREAIRIGNEVLRSYHMDVDEDVNVDV